MKWLIRILSIALWLLLIRLLYNIAFLALSQESNGFNPSQEVTQNALFVVYFFALQIGCIVLLIKGTTLPNYRTIAAILSAIIIGSILGLILLKF